MHAACSETMLPRDRVLLFAEDDDLVEALGELGQSELSRGLVVDGDRLVGSLSITDVARVLEIAAPRRPRPGG
jgi:CBS domain-containing protein